MSREESRKRYEQTPGRKAYLREYMKAHYTTVHYSVVKERYQFVHQGVLIVIEPEDMLVRVAPRSPYFNCFKRGLRNLLIPSVLLRRTGGLIKKGEVDANH